MSQRRRLPLDDRRAQLVALGVRLFTERAYDEVAIDDIAAAAGVAKGLLYHYFGGKKAFYRACLEVSADAMVDACTPDPALPGPQRVVQGLSAYLAFVDGRAAAFLALVQGQLGQDPEIAAVLEHTRARLAEQMLTAIGLEPPFRPAFRVAVRAWLGAVEAASTDWLRHRDLSQESLILLLGPALRAHLEAAIALDPGARVVLE